MKISDILPWWVETTESPVVRTLNAMLGKFGLVVCNRQRLCEALTKCRNKGYNDGYADAVDSYNDEVDE